MSRLHALIIDDNDLSFMLGEVLRNRNFSVTVAETLIQAKLEAKNVTPSVIILDYTLPDGKGTEIIPYLNKTCPFAKIFMITGDYDNLEEDFEGITQFIRKPFSLNNFRSIIETSLEEV